MVLNYQSSKISHPAPGITRRVMASGRNLMLTEHTLEKGAVLPEHHHPHEQLVYLLAGTMIIEMNGAVIRMATGDSLDIPSEVVHKATALEPATVLDIFSPCRQDYL
jgi:quercetin dioxygenase-like cupin family protein